MKSNQIQIVQEYLFTNLFTKGAKRNVKQVEYDGEPFEVEEEAMLSDVMPDNVTSVLDANGNETTRGEFKQSPVPDNFVTLQTKIEKGDIASRNGLLTREIMLLKEFLQEWEEPANGQVRTVSMEANNSLMLIRNFPLPDGYSPDYVDVMLDVGNYPAKPPVGMYILTKNNKKVIAKMTQIFGNHLFESGAYYEAKKIDGFTWICHHYANHRWSLNARNLRRGDNIRKFVEVFLARL